MKIKNVIEIAEDRLMSDICLRWYLETDGAKKQEIYVNEILPLYKKINNII
tara:strand:+ start:1666 stop:1818 length:153 start_codon:yes stop_codon:yes gene_type:complete